MEVINEKPRIEIHLGDCLEILKTIPDKSIDLVLTDPPYNLRFKNKIAFSTRKDMYHYTQELKEGWDNVNLKELYSILFPEFNRILKDNGSLLLFTSQEGVGYSKDIAKENNLDMKCEIVWIKNNPIPQVRKRNYLCAFECIVWFARWNDKKCNFTFNFYANQKEMHNVFKYPICQGNERTEHPTQKPRKLISHLLQIHSNKNDTILDPFMGSGTTLVAAKELGRNAIGIEIEPKYYEIAKRRINQAIAELF